MRYAMQSVEDLLLVSLERGVALVDTGSPVSIGHVEELEVAGRRYRAWTALASLVLDPVAEELGRPVDWILGGDVLCDWTLVLDWPGRAADFLPPGQAPAGERIPLTVELGVPWVEVEVRGRRARAVLDTGAQLSYADPAAVAGLAPEGEQEDFNPALGRFRTPVYRLEVRFGSRLVSARFGVLPALGRALFPGPWDGWVLGSDFFRGRRLALDYAGGALVDATERATPARSVSAARRVPPRPAGAPGQDASAPQPG